MRLGRPKVHEKKKMKNERVALYCDCREYIRILPGKPRTPSSLADRAADDTVRTGFHHPVVDLGGVQLTVQVLVQSVAEHPDALRGLLIYFQVVGETDGPGAPTQCALRAGPERPAGVPTAHLALRHQPVVHHAVGTHGHGGRLARLPPAAPGPVECGEVLDQVAGVQRHIPQRRGRHVELVVAGHGVEVQ